MTIASSPAGAAPADRRAWLRALPARAKRSSRRAALFTVLDVAGAIGFAGGLALILDPFSRPLSGGAPMPNLGPNLGAILGLGLALSGALTRAVFAHLAAGAGGEAAADVKAQLRRAAVRTALQTLPSERRPLGETLAVAADAVDAVDGYLARFAPAQTAAALGPLLIAAVMALASPVAGLIVLLTFAPFIAGMIIAGGAAEREAGRQFEALSRLSSLFADRIRQLPLLLAFQGERTTVQRLAEASEILATRTLKVLRMAFLSSAVLEFFAALSVALVAVYCGFNLLHLLPFPAPEQLDLRRAVFVLALAPEAYLPMRRLAAAYHDRQKADAAAAALIPASHGALPRARRTLSLPPSIRFENVAVVYPGETAAALRGFTLTLEPGDSVAVMGPTGAGKTTLISLLLGLVAASAGEIRVDGAPLAHGAPLAAFAGQAPVVISGSLRDNIALAARDAPLPAVVEAARRAGLLNTPGGLERRVDDRGGGLSGGERRRLGLARAFLSPAPLILLDEPTANLDADAEAALLPVIAAAMRGRTALLVTHSERVAALADRVVRLDA